jgi:hypothetical protein
LAVHGGQQQGLLQRFLSDQRAERENRAQRGVGGSH